MVVVVVSCSKAVWSESRVTRGNSASVLLVGQGSLSTVGGGDP